MRWLWFVLAGVELNVMAFSGKVSMGMIGIAVVLVCILGVLCFELPARRP